MDLKNTKKKFYVLYTVIFLFVSICLVAYFYLLNSKSINCGGDNYRQFFLALKYYSRYLKEIVNSIFEGKIVISQWDYSVGEGSDILQTFVCYGLGDPFYFFCFLIPEKYLFIFYDFITILKLYCCGLSFSYLCFYFKKFNIYAVLSGSLAYTFSSISVMTSLTFPSMLAILIYLPVIIIGIEDVIENGKGNILTLSVFLSSITSFYFLYVEVIAAIVYYVIRVIVKKKSIKDIINISIKEFLHSLKGLLLGAFIILPVLYLLINNTRLDNEYPIHLVYSLSSYKTMFTNLSIATPNGSIGFGSLAITVYFATYSLVNNKKSKTLLILIILCSLLICLPFAGQLFNGFSYSSTRWTRIVILPFCYSFVLCFEDIIVFNRKDISILAGTFVIYFALCLCFDRNNYKIYALLLVITLAILAIILFCKKNGIKHVTLLLATMLFVVIQITYILLPQFWNYVSNGISINVFLNENEELSALHSIDDDSLYRYSGNELETNVGVLSDKSNTYYYWSLSNGDIGKFRELLGLNDHSVFHYSDYDDRSALMQLSSIKYYLSKENNAPENYDYYKKSNDINVYKNNNSLQFVYAYSDKLSYDNWLNLEIVDKEKALTKYAVVDKGDDVNISFNNKKTEFQIVDKESIEFENNKIVVKKDNAKLKIQFDYLEQGNYYLVINDLYWISDQKTSWQDHQSTNILVDSGIKTTTVYYKDFEHSRYSNRHDFVVNLGYYESNDIKETEIVFPDSGIYDYSSIYVKYVPTQELEENTRKLNNLEISEFTIETNRIQTSISIEEDKTVVFSFPYLKGWKAYIDGKEISIQKVNVQYMGFDLSKGTHNIVLEYQTPLLKEGAIISAINLFILVIENIIKKHLN